ncbi:hypothetical protein RhiJN_19540 [Ceratobasidium sp. AG-Ba]|nr:hypothetical protein RhiJN_04704 [Ceratobasidium sp. AG-Ba]QRV91522.1 hypothetical protein RhiJN_19540 [Ceratobasidium sp. AG-Ba]QRW05590.1 hypothetical protein RhiLY_04589 [Ceratobasidium sp. AG-Ba]
MSAVAVQQPPLAIHHAFQQKRHAAAPPASITAPATPKQARTPGIITLSKPLATPPRSSARARKVTPPRAADVFQPGAKSEPRSAKKTRSRPTSDEDEHETPSKPRGRRPNNAEKSLPTPAASPVVAAAKSRRNPSRARQSPSPTTESDSPAPAPAIQKPSGRLAKHRRGLTRSTPALCEAAAATPSAPVPVPQRASVSSQPSGLSRSAPLATPAMSQTIPARMRRTLTGSEPAPATRDTTSKDVPPSPSPPRRVREASWKSQGPLTAPLNGGAGFPSRPGHVRSPSEALFNLSLDETDDEPQDMPILFGRATRGGDKVYAGGKFQNGPDTTTLPAPSFLSGF